MYRRRRSSIVLRRGSSVVELSTAKHGGDRRRVPAGAALRGGHTVGVELIGDGLQAGADQTRVDDTFDDLDWQRPRPAETHALRALDRQGVTSALGDQPAPE